MKDITTEDIKDYISIELLDEVLDETIEELDIQDEIIYYKNCYDQDLHINVYKLSFLVKDWIVNNVDYSIIIQSSTTEGNANDGQITILKDGNDWKYMEALTEPIAIFQAGNYIFEHEFKQKQIDNDYFER